MSKRIPNCIRHRNLNNRPKMTHRHVK